MAKITEKRTYEIADVTAFPDEVSVVVATREFNLTPDQAREFGRLLIAAADAAPHTDWDDSDPDHPRLHDTRTPLAV